MSLSNNVIVEIDTKHIEYKNQQRFLVLHIGMANIEHYI